jgi:hypothetical protein
MSTQPEVDAIQAMAYRIWEERGRPADSSDDCWREAEQRCREEHGKSAKATDDALKASFPASDPPASHLPDEVPVNAEDKWVAAAESTRPPARLRMVTERKA